MREPLGEGLRRILRLHRHHRGNGSLVFAKVEFQPHLLGKPILKILHNRIVDRCRHHRIAVHDAIGSRQRSTVLPPKMWRKRLIAGTAEKRHPVPEVEGVLAVVELIGRLAGLFADREASQEIDIIGIPVLIGAETGGPLELAVDPRVIRPFTCTKFQLVGEIEWREDILRMLRILPAHLEVCKAILAVVRVGDVVRKNRREPQVQLIDKRPTVEVDRVVLTPEIWIPCGVYLGEVARHAAGFGEGDERHCECRVRHLISRSDLVQIGLVGFDVEKPRVPDGGLGGEVGVVVVVGIHCDTVVLPNERQVSRCRPA